MGGHIVRTASAPAQNQAHTLYLRIRRYLDMGWDVFTALQRHCRVKDGYVGLEDVRDPASPKVDYQPSYFLAETLKYLLLLFSPKLLPLEHFVFNTEAHPLRRGLGLSRCASYRGRVESLTSAESPGAVLANMTLHLETEHANACLALLAQTHTLDQSPKWTVVVALALLALVLVICGVCTTWCIRLMRIVPVLQCCKSSYCVETPTVRRVPL